MENLTVMYRTNQSKTMGYCIIQLPEKKLSVLYHHIALNTNLQPSVMRPNSCLFFWGGWWGRWTRLVPHSSQTKFSLFLMLPFLFVFPLITSFSWNYFLSFLLEILFFSLLKFCFLYPPF